MVAYIFCLTASGGVPVFARNKNGLKPLPFPVIGSLNGVHMFAKSHDVELLSTVTDDSKIVWKSFNDSLTLVVIAEDDNADDCHLANVLLYVFDAMIMLLGFDEVTNIKNVERFKKDARVCFPLIDRFLEDHDLLTFGDLVNAVDVIAAPENSVLQSFLDAFAECADSPYGCLLVHGKVSVATRKWWSLTSGELVLISALISSFSSCSSRDVPVFLPDASPSVPHRLMTFQLTRHIEVCVLCGPSPSLADLEEEVGRFWRTSYESLRAVLQNHPSNVPSNTVLDSNLLGFLLVNVETNRCLCSVHPPSTDDEVLEVHEKRHILRSYYKHVVGNFFASKIEGSGKGPSDFTHSAMDTYMTTDTHKCYAMLSPPYQIYALYNTNIPTFAMRNITEKTLQILTKDKSTQL
ncbi:protein fuzzy homolog isoform X1 [Ruditapes philippinarum]|uniref:protein fuzzy homolog isoform X1 n=2 Tax=Ruditapes philippinarum TaxID=129788 RepID=UPI00295BEAF9|nr:protein fuzzy homolog isoform X1 [Ruditapes philippinarum]